MSFLETDSNLNRRERNEKIWKTILGAASLVSVALLILLLVRMLADGLGSMGADFWTNTFRPSQISSGRAGVLDSILNTIVVLAMTMAFALPLGIAAGVYLHEYAGTSKLTDWIRATVSNLAAVPSVVYGLLGLAIFVRGMANLTGGVAQATNLSMALTLGVLVLPVVIVATEEALKTVPMAAREASLAMGATKWQTIRHHVLPYALPGILTGNILALSRAAGETAPLLVLTVPTFVTKLDFTPLGVGTPLQVRAYSLTGDPRAAALDLAAGVIVVLLVATLILNLLAIVLRDRISHRIRW